ncbi:hypothetical protein OVY01_10070 [Robbsia sp. Bb-Pol-6]|uniref:Uncharacterized protein n=1 Tax=Robbsia betulipollinis TaxID=2981849 RepID=A0ABT3ZNP3_9BURK|nr:hypothetical protein [Robbsia betulipollinis]MCY0387573.1 hypothetical protein [Robbsia betulipollinis]
MSATHFHGRNPSFNIARISARHDFEKRRRNHSGNDCVTQAGLAPVLFAAWFSLSGWFSFAVMISRAPGMPDIGNSQ